MFSAIFSDMFDKIFLRNEHLGWLRKSVSLLHGINRMSIVIRRSIVVYVSGVS